MLSVKIENNVQKFLITKIWQKLWQCPFKSYTVFIDLKSKFCFQVPQCLKDLSPSAWNPPPGGRRLAGLYSSWATCMLIGVKLHHWVFIFNFFVTILGDLLYLEVVTLEDVHANVTASTSGFYINRLDKLTKLANRF